MHQYHGDPSPSINHVFVEDWFDDDDLKDKVVDFDSFSEDSERGFKIFTSSVVMAPHILVASPTGARSTPVTSFVGAQSTPVAPPPCVMTAPVEPLDGNVSLAAIVNGSLTPVEPSPSSGCQQQTHESASVPKGTKGWDFVFNCLGPQEGTSVVDYSEANLPTVYAPTQMSVEAELVSGSGVVAPNSGGWGIVQSKRIRHKPSPSKQPHVEPCPAQGISRIDHRDHQLSPLISVSHTTSALAPNDILGFRTNKGKYVVVSGARGCLPLLLLDDLLLGMAKG
ncbi:hypothetical protein POTOM_048830 [Populus tomentosa]|uniref:Uncharacterized protein n=1 Tax=Populus tomentosa TaxID=118781 RepID=A0A8X7YH76_POPTO|nr:hypothetical protein POTOM_048830 [Populus tomentosa]